MTELPSGLVGLCLLSILGLVLFLSLKMRQRFGKLDRILGRNSAAQKNEIGELKESLSLLIAREKNLAEREAKRFEKLNRSVTALRGDLKKQSETLRKQAQTLKQQRALLDEVAPSLEAIQDGQMETRYIAALNALPLKYPAFCGRWAIDGFLAKELIDHLAIHRPRVVLELGSGVSTVLIATALESLGLTNTRHIAVDHLVEFLENTRKMVDYQGLKRTTEYWHCPLSEGSSTAPPWYTDLPRRLEGLSLDLAVVDGPPGQLHAGARSPALRVLRPFLSERGFLLLDDVGRPEETAIVNDWKSAYPELDARVYEKGKQHAIFRVQENTKSSKTVTEGGAR